MEPIEDNKYETYKSCRILVSGDPHLKKKDTIVYRKQIAETIRVAKELKENGGLDMIVVLGDTLDTKGVIDVTCQCDAKVFFNDLFKIATTMVLIGNHDRTSDRSYDKAVHPFVGLTKSEDNGKRLLVVEGDIFAYRAIATQKKRMIVKGAEPLTRYKNTEHISIGSEKMRFVFVPYVEPGKFEEELDLLINKVRDKGFVPTAIFAHQEIYGCKLRDSDTTSTSTAGDKWRETDPLLISGHIHKYHKPQDNVIYVGTPRQVKISEDCDKGLTVFEFFTDGEYTMQRIPIDILPFVHSVIDASQLDTYTPQHGRRCVLTLTGTSTDICAAIRSERGIQLKNLGVSIGSAPNRSQLTDVHIERREYCKGSVHESLKRRIRSDKEVCSVYDQLFGQMYGTVEDFYSKIALKT